MNSAISHFVSLVSVSLPFREVFNPWADVDRDHDIGSFSPEIRKEHLSHYLEVRVGTAELLLIGEAVGYQGGHFSGIAMTSERILLGFQRVRGIHPEDVLPDFKPRRTSKPEIMPRGFAEPTATIVWGAVLSAGLRSTEFALWNAFVWHPFNGKKGILSNRRPQTEEIIYSRNALISFLELFPGAVIIGVGKTSEDCLNSLELDFHAVRHPAQGGAREFRSQLLEILVKRTSRWR
jgi:hypothetical protein